MVVMVAAAAAATGRGRAQAAQILQYTESRHSRSEAGVPGSNVTGGWSWVDHLGQRRHIWYVADTGGFRAFGDITPQADSVPLNVGVPVVVAILPTQPPSSPQLKGRSATQSTLTPDPAEEGSQQDSTVERTGSFTNQAEREEITPPTDRNLQQNSKATLLDGIRERPDNKISVGQEREETITTTTTTTTSPATAAPTNTEDSITETPLPCATHSPKTSTNGEPLTPTDDTKHGSPKSLSPPDSNLPEEKSTDQSPVASFLTAKQSPVTPSDNNFVASVFDKLSTVLGAPADNMQKPLLHQQQQENEVVSVSSIPEIELSPTSDFVLVNRLRAPTVPKTRVGTQRLVPKPVDVMGRTAPVVMGLHTSGKPSTARPRMHVVSDLQPLGIHLLNLVPVPQKSVSTNRPVPQPVRVVGEPNLDNFWSPARLARTTPPPFRQPNPTQDNDYQYYDYYDYTDTGGENTGGPVGNPSHKTKTKTVRSNSEEYSLETDYSDSEESEDSNYSQ